MNFAHRVFREIVPISESERLQNGEEGFGGAVSAHVQSRNLPGKTRTHARFRFNLKVSDGRKPFSSFSRSVPSRFCGLVSDFAQKVRKFGSRARSAPIKTPLGGAGHGFERLIRKGMRVNTGFPGKAGLCRFSPDYGR